MAIHYPLRENAMVGGDPGFWASIFRPIQSDTAITPTLAVLRVVSPLCLILATLTRGAPSSWFFALGAAPVVIVLLQIVYFTVSGKIENLRNDKFLRDMKKLDGLLGANDGSGATEVKFIGGADSNNPRLETSAPLLTEQPGSAQ